MNYNIYNKITNRYLKRKDDKNAAFATSYDITNFNFWFNLPPLVLCEYCGISHKGKLYEYDLVKRIDNHSRKTPVDGIAIKSLDGVSHIIHFDGTGNDIELLNYKKVGNIFEYGYNLKDVVKLIPIIVNNFPSVYKEGLIQEEVLKIINMFSFLNFEKKYYDNANMGITVYMIDSKTVYPHIDIVHALYAGYEKRGLHSYEFD